MGKIQAHRSCLPAKKDLIDQRRFGLNPGKFILRMDFQGDQQECKTFAIKKRVATEIGSNRNRKARKLFENSSYFI